MELLVRVDYTSRMEYLTKIHNAELMCNERIGYSLTLLGLNRLAH